MSTDIVISAPLLASVVALEVAAGDAVQTGDTLLVLEVMKVQTSIVAPAAGVVADIMVSVPAMVKKGTVLMRITPGEPVAAVEVSTAPNLSKTNIFQSSVHQEFRKRILKTLDAERSTAAQSRHAKGFRSARENLHDLCDPDSFVEYGQLAVAAQRGRIDYQELQSSTAADGILTGIGLVNSDEFGTERSRTALIINDYSVLAGTQGFFHHKKLDRILAVAKAQRLPVIMYTEGGGGRPGDTDVTTVNSGLQCESFASWAALCGQVPRIAVANGYNFAGNAALFGAADITIATKNSWVGMAGPAMIAGGGLGLFKPTDIGPIEVQSANGVVDIIADDEAHASQIAKHCLAFFQGATTGWHGQEQSSISSHLPENRRFTYEVRDIICTLADQHSFVELKRGFGGAIVTGLLRLEGQPIGLIASDCNVLGGAIDVDAGEKAADFMNLCNGFSIPVLSLCDTPGFMVGPEHEQRGAVRRLAKLFTAGAQLTVPLVAIVLRKCYGLGAQAMLGGSTSQPIFTAAWPSGEFGPMGLEGAVQLGYKKELDAETDSLARKQLFDQLLAQAYARGQATEVATVLEIDAVIEPANTRAAIIAAFGSARST